MYFKNISRIRAVIIVPVLAGLFFWHSVWLPAPLPEFLNYLIPIIAGLSVVNEIVYAIYLRRAFAKVRAEVVPREETTENNLPVKHYDLRFELNGGTFVSQFSETLMSNNLSNISHCDVLIHKAPPHVMMLDGFKTRYINLIFALMLVAIVYYYRQNQG